MFIKIYSYFNEHKILIDNQKEIDFNLKIKQKRSRLLVNNHLQKIKTFKWIVNVWPEHVYIEELIINDRKASIKGFTTDLNELNQIKLNNQEKIIIQSINSTHSGWNYLCDIWFFSS
jgi:hypothetical protein